MKELKLYFVLKKARQSKDGLAPLKCRISFGKNDEVESKTVVKINPDNWDSKKQLVFGIPRYREYNSHLNSFVKKIESVYEELYSSGKDFDAQTIKNYLEGEGEAKSWTVLELVNEHNDRFKLGVQSGLKDHSKTTLYKYYKLHECLSLFIKKRYNRKDYNANDLNYDFIESFIYFLRTTRKLGEESIRSCYYYKIRKIVNHAVKIGRINRQHPFGDFKMDAPTGVIDDSKWLTMDDFILLLSTKFTSERLERVRIRTVITLFTGLSYIDMENLHVDDIHKDINGFMYIQKNRKKSDKESIIPIFPEIEPLVISAMETADERDGKLLPPLSNQKYSQYLKEMIKSVGIDKDTSPHKLRHSFAQVSIDAGMSVEAVSKMLGHSNTRTVLKHYAKLSKARVYYERNKFQDAVDKAKAQKSNDISDTGT